LITAAEEKPGDFCCCRVGIVGGRCLAEEMGDSSVEISRWDACEAGYMFLYLL